MSPPAAEPEPPVDKQEERVDPEILIPAFVSPAGRDSLGRAVAVARDRAVRHERGGVAALPAQNLPRSVRRHWPRSASQGPAYRRVDW